MSNYNEEMVMNNEAVEGIVDAIETGAENAGPNASTVVKVLFALGGLAAAAVGAFKLGKIVKEKHEEKHALTQPEEGTIIEPDEEDLAALSAK